MALQDYIDKHLILKIGSNLPTYIANEIIVDNPKEFIKIVIQNNCYIPYILWWDRAEISKGSPIGYGGPRDPHSELYFFAETYIERKFEPTTSIEEYYRYLDEILKTYHMHDLYPGFDIKAVPLAAPENGIRS